MAVGEEDLATPSTPDKRCSFCTKTPDQVSILITSDTAAICEECVDLCLDMLVERGTYLVAFPRLRSIGRKLLRWFNIRP